VEGNRWGRYGGCDHLVSALGGAQEALGDALCLRGVSKGCVVGTDGLVSEPLGGVGGVGGGLGAGADEVHDWGGVGWGRVGWVEGGYKEQIRSDDSNCCD
jgi:hypothetical protein